MTIRAELADGRVLEFPDGTDPGVIQATVKRMIAAPQGAQDFSQVPTAELEAMPSAPTSISDIARSLGIGVVGGAKALTDVFGAGSTASEYLGETARELQKGLTPARQAEIAKRQELEKRAAESGDTLKEVKTFLGGVAEAPLQSLVQGVGSSAPTLLASLAAIPAGAPAGLALGVGIISRAALGAAQGVGEQKGSILDEVEQAYIKAGYEKEQARELALKAQEYSQDKALQFGGAALLGALDAFTGMESGVSKAARAAASKKIAGATADKIVEGLPEKELARPGVIGSAARSAIGEAPLEGVQGGYGQYSTNLALIKEGLLDPDLAMQGVYGAAARDAAVGALTGAAFTPVEQANRMREYQMDQALRQQQDAGLAVSEEELAQRFPDVLPGGFKINREELGTETVPQGFSIMAEGRDEPLSVVDTQDEANAKLEALTKIREQEREKILKDEEKINADVKKSRDRLEYLEATEQTGTDEYQSLKAELPNLMDESAQKIKDLYERSESLSKPLTVMPFGEAQRVNEQFNVLGPDQKPVGTFKTIGEAEAVVTKAVGEDVFKQTQQNRETAKELYKTFVPQMRKFGLGDVGLNIVDRIENGAGGAYLNKLIKVSLEEANPVQTMRHEALHAMKDLGFFKPQQWKALEDRANKQWIKELKEAKYDEKQSRYDAYVDLFTKEGEQKGLSGKELDQYVNEAVVEEAIADAFGAYDKGAKPPPGMIASLYKKIKDFFASLGQAFRGAGFQSADDIFQNIERGRLKPAAEAKPVAEEKLSLRVANKVGKQLDLAKEEIDSTSISLQTGKAGVDQFKKQPVGGLPQVVQFLENRRKASGLKNLDITSEEDREELAKLMAAEAMAAINAGGNALQWYDSVIDSMMNMASLKYPELATNEDNKAALRMAIAIASQGLNVEDNLTFAMSQYDYFRQNGRFKETGSGADGAAMKSNFTLANQMIEQYGLTDLRKFLQTEFTVEELRGAGFDIGGELGDEKVTGSAIFGPKIGFGFYSNLSGNFEPVTMDMWFMRTVGRLTGKLKGFDQKKFDDQLKRFRESFSDRGEDGLYADEFKDEEIQKAMDSVEGAVNLSRVVNSVFNSDFKNNRELYDEGARKKTDLVYAAQNIIKSFDAPKDAPQNGTERRLLRDVVARTVDKVAKAYGKRIPPASLQALIWYPEQELYKALGVKLRVTSQDYAGAIKKLLMKEGYNESTIDGAAKSGPRAVQPVAGKQVQAGVAPTGKKPQAVFEPTEREEFLEKRKTEQVLKQEREAPRRKKVIFEVAPDPNNVELTERWNALPQADRLRISNNISKKIIEQAKADLDFDGRVVSQVGSYLNDTNPSFALFLEKGDAVEISKFLGYALSQDSMMVVSPKPAPGMEKVGAVVVDVRTQSPSEVDAIYQKLREISLNGEQPVGGQTTMNNKMIVLNYSGVKTEELAQLIDKKLGGTYDVQYTDVYSAFPEKKDYDYASPENDPRGKGKAVRERARALRADATKLLEEELGTKAQAPAREEKFSLKAPTSPEFKRWFGDSKIVNKDGTPMVMYHGLAKDTTDFTRKTERGAPIFLTDDPEFAERFAADSYESVARNPQKYLSKQQIDGGVKRAIAAIRKDYGKDTLGLEMIESLKTGNLNDATPEAREYIQKEFIELLPTGPHIMPMYVRAERPFDYENPSHIRKVLAELTEDAYDPADIRSGSWESIENADFQDAIQNAGFDSFYVKEHGRKNLAVYQPNQVKSATGNVGTYSLESPDVRYSLRGVAFPTAKEAQEATDAVKVPDTPEFKQYIAGSQWVDEDGKAKKFFHATTSNFFEFNDGVIYLSDTAEESAKWGRMAEDRLRERIYKALNKDEKLPFFQQAVDQAVSKDKITKAQGEKFMRDATRNIPGFDSYDLIKKEMDDVLLSLSPERMKIMPLYARAMTPFDFRNKEHVQQVINAFDYTETMDRKVGEVAKQINKQIGGAPTVNVEHILDGLKGILAQGYPKVVERPDIMRTIRKLGFDGYVVRRNRTAPMSYAVFKPEQVKSITGNDGQFSLETKDVRYSLSRVRYTPERFEKLLSESAYSNDTTTKGYMAFVDPMDFVKATSTQQEFDRVKSEQEPLDFARMSGLADEPKMFVSKRGDEWKILDHEGRHRMLAMHDAGYRSVPVYIQFYSGIEDAKTIPVKAINGQTGAINSIVMVAEAEPLSYANKDRAMKKFTGMDSDVKYSMPTLSKDTVDRIKEVAPQRYQPGWKERVIGGLKPDYTELRQRFLNRYETFANYDERNQAKIRAAGGPELLADQRAEFAALQSDLSAGVAASAMGIGDRQGGIPVYRNGFTTIDTSVKGLTEALAPLAKYDKPTSTEDTDIYSKYQFWAGWKRGRRLLREGREQVYTAADAKRAQEIENNHPEFIQVQKDLIAFNNGIVNYAVQTGVLSRERAQLYTQYADYIPFYRQLDLDKTIGPNPFGGISGVKGPKELKGGESPLGDFLENMVRNTQSMINAGMKNAAAQRATKVALEIKEVERLPGKADGLGFDVYTQLENGQLVYYRSSDSLFIEALKSLNMPDLPFMGLLSAPANVLRNLVTKDPGFMMANLLRDSLSSYVTSGQKITPIVGTMVNFGKALSAKDKNLQALFNAGIIGGYEFSQNIEQSGQSLSDDLNKKAGKDAILLRPFKSLWEGLEKGTTASDAATRMAVYERVMKETGNEAEAISRALEVMNFNRKGNSVLIRIATAALPFFNARLQGLDLFYRASTGQMNTQDAKEIKKRFWIRGMTMSALSVMYYLSVADDEEYEKQEEETKDNNWIFPIFGIRIPIPFEVGTLFKTMPERITAYLMGNDTGKELGQSTLRALANTFALNPIPQTFKPIIEAATNYNFFTMRPIVGQGMQEVEARFQVGPGTSKSAEYIGGILNLSPLKVDQVIKGYTGTIGGYVTDVVDSITSQFSDVPKASLRFEQLPVVKRFVSDPEARGSVTQFYELQRSVDTVVRTMSLLEKTARPEEFAKYLQDNIGLLAVKDYVRDIEKSMKELREMRRTINSSPMKPDEKRDILIDLGRMENNLTANIGQVKKAISDLK